MFDIGFLEIALISIIALLVVGPERLPKMVRTIGLWMGRIRRYINQAKNDIDREVRLHEWKEQLAKPASEFTQIRKVANETKEVLQEAKSAIESADSQVSNSAPSIASERAENASIAEEKPDDPIIGAEPSLKPKPTRGDSSGDPEGLDRRFDSDGPSSSDAATTPANSVNEAQSDRLGISTGADGGFVPVDGSDGDIPVQGTDPVAPSKENPVPEAVRSSSESTR